MTTTNANLKGIGFLLPAIIINSRQNVAVKWIGGNYSVLEIVAVRSLIALPYTTLLYRYKASADYRPQNNVDSKCVRSLFLFFPYTTRMIGLAALTPADVEAIR